MSEAKHTPGPWRVEVGTTLIWAPDGNSINGVPVAMCDTAYRSWGRQIPLDEHEANAALIAAAPAMFEALQAVEAWLDRWAVHVGRCTGGTACSCGLTNARAEVTAALSQAQPQPSDEVDG